MKTSTIEKSIEIRYEAFYTLSDTASTDQIYVGDEEMSLIEAIEQVEKIKKEHEGNLYTLAISTIIVNISGEKEEIVTRDVNYLI